MKCTYCEREINNKGSLAAHEKCCKKNPNRVPHQRSPLAGAKKGSVPWNKGKTGVQKSWNKGLKGISTGVCADPEKEKERRRKLSKVAKARKLGGYVQGSGRGKKGWYKGFFCDSSWELAYIIYCLDHNIDIKRCTEKRQYMWEGKQKNYIPDFVVDGRIVEIKGYKSKQWLAKLSANQDVTVLYEKDLRPMLEYVVNTYGKDFLSLYE